MSDLKYLGWGRFTSTGKAYREWKFEKDVPELEAKKGWELVDMGPSEEPRFVVWDTAKHARSSRWKSEDVYAQIKAITGLPWNPPREGEEKIAEAIEGLTSYLKGFARGQESRAEKTLWKMQALLEEARRGTATETQEPTAKENLYLRFKREGSYNNTGESFKIWTLKVDVSTLPIDGHLDVGGKRHAQAGDELWEKTDPLEPCVLKRDENEVGNPEWWQVRHLFAGLKDEIKEEDVVEEMPPHHKRALALLGEGRCVCAHVVERDVPEVAIRAGDLIVYDYGPDFPEMHGRVRYLSMDDYKALRDATLDSYSETFSPVAGADLEVRRGTHGWLGCERLCAFLGSQNKWGKRLKVWHSRLAVVRSSRSPVGEPIAASSDDAALFELIYSAGGRMPEKRA